MHHPKPDATITKVRGFVAAITGSGKVRIVVPRTTTQHVPPATVYYDSCSTLGSTIVVVCPAILNPFPYVAMHIVQAEFIR